MPLPLVAAMVGGSLLSGLFGNSASKRAARAQQQGSAAATEEQRRQYDTSRADQMPFLQTGYAANDRINALLGGDTSAFRADPGYQWQFNEGQRGVERSAAARGGAASGNALRALTQYGQGMADQSYGNYWNRLAGVAGFGQNTAQGLGALGANSANNIGNLMQSGGDARASGVLGAANSVTGALNSGLNNYLLYRGGAFGGTQPQQPRYPWDERTSYGRGGGGSTWPA